MIADDSGLSPTVVGQIRATVHLGQLPTEKRTSSDGKALLLTRSGMSQRKAAEFLSVDHKTVGSDLQAEVPPHLEELIPDALDGLPPECAELAGVAPCCVITEDDPAEIVLAAEERRHLSPGQRAAWRAKVMAQAGYRQNGRWKRGAVDSHGSVNTRTGQNDLSRAGLILDYLPDLLHDVIAGTVALDDAHPTRIGELLGPASPNGKGAGSVVTDPRLTKDQRHDFRKMAEHADTVDEEYLDELAATVRHEYRRSREALGEALDAYFAVGHALLAARRALPSDQAFGAWFRAQEFGFSRQWAHVLQRAADAEPLVRQALSTQVANGTPNIKKAVQQVTAAHGGTRSERPALTAVPADDEEDETPTS